MELKCSRNCHALYNLEYHLILVTKYRKRCINDAVFQTIKRQMEKVAEMNGAVIEEIAYEEDHVHVLFSAPPQVCLSSMINSMKSTTSRMVRKEHEAHLKQFYRKPYFWNRSYLILSSGGAPIEVIRQYIQEQGTEEHAAKKQKSKQKAANTT